MKGAKLLLMAGALLFLGAGAVNAAGTIYSDDFSGSSGTDLNGLAPDIRPGTEAWTAAAGYKADGSFEGTTFANLSAYLPFTPEAGKQYRLSVRVSNLDNASNSVRWGGLGFADDTVTVSSTVLLNGVTALRLSQGGTVTATFDGTKAVAAVGGCGPAETLSTVLTTHADATPWTADFYIGETLLGSHEWATAPTITRVALSVNNSGGITGNFDDFSLTELPAPVTAGLSFELIGQRKTPHSDWSEHAQWITTPEFAALAGKDTLRDPTPCPMFRRVWQTGKPVRSARLRITAMGAYRAWINGQLVSPDRLAPGWTQFGVRVLYQDYDVTPLVREGGNAIAVLLGDGFYRFPRPEERGGDPTVRQAINGGDNVPRLIAALDIRYEDGSIETVATGPDWKCLQADSPWRYASLYLGGEFDARLYDPDWTQPSFDSTAWPSAVPMPLWDGVEITKQFAPPIQTLREVDPVAVTEPEPGLFVFDFGVNLSGICRATFAGLPAGTRVGLRYAEYVDRKGMIDVSTLVHNKDNEDVFISSGKKEEVFEIPFTYHGFRYVEVRGLPGRDALKSLVAVHFGDTLKPLATFTSSDPRLNRLWEMIELTYEGSLKSLLADTTARNERFGWLGDGYTTHGHTMSYFYDAAAFHRKRMMDCRDQVAWRPGNPEPGPAPTRAPGFGITSGTMWSDAATFVPYDSYVLNGDRQIMEEHYDSARAWIDYCIRMNGGAGAWQETTPGLPLFRVKGEWLDRSQTLPPGTKPEDWGLRVDWKSGVSPRSISVRAFNTAWWGMSTRTLARMADALGKPEDARKYDADADAIRDAYFNEFDNGDGTWDMDDQSVYAYGLVLGPPTDELKQQFIDGLVRTVHAYGDHISGGTGSFKLILRELSNNGHADLAWKLAMRPEMPSFGYMVDVGSSTVWERFDLYHPEAAGISMNDNMRGSNHSGLLPVGEWIVEDVVGLRPDPEQPGFKHFFIVPWTGTEPASVDFTYDSPRGPIRVAWERDGEKLALNVTVPPETTATVKLPGTDGVTVNGKPAKTNEFELSGGQVPPGELVASFLHPPLHARPMVYWMWVNGNISREGITRDLEHMKTVGLGGGLLFDVPPLRGGGSPGGYAVSAGPGPVAFMSNEWLDLVNFAAEESHRLDLDFGVVLCSAWNTGGPWIKPRNNNQNLASSLTRVSGTQAQPVALPPPSTDPDYADIAVLAWPTPANESHLMTDRPPAITVNGQPGNMSLLKAMMDNDRATAAAVTAPGKNSPTVIEFVFPEPVTVDRFYAQEEPRMGISAGTLEAEVNGTMKKLADLKSDGLTPHAVEFSPVTAQRFRLTATETPPLAVTRGHMRLHEVAFVEPGKWAASEPIIRNWSLKSAKLNILGRRPGLSTLPQDHLNATPDHPRTPRIDPASVVNLTPKLGADGKLAWAVPPGDWTIQRIGMAPTGKHPYNAEGREGNEGALESDKQSADATRLHYEKMAGEILARLSLEGRKGLNFFHVDSWEGQINLWTQGFQQEFKRRRGYDLTPYLPVFEGRIVSDAATTDRVLWDYRRTIADLNIDNHFKELADLCHADGVKLSAQAGHGFQANMDAIGSIAQADYPSGEFWFGGRGAARYGVRNSVKDASSAVNVYGKAHGLFESFTTGRFPNFWPAPYDMKKLGDFALSEGVSRMFFHGMWHESDPVARPPGLMWGAGLHVGPSITWMPDGRAFFDYLSRCQYLLQAGAAAKDVLYFYGDGMPNITPTRDELPFNLPAGRDYDATDSRAIRELISVQDGKLTVPHGSTYRLLVLPPIDTILPETLEAVARLVRDGAVIVGPKPLRSPSLSGQPEADRRVRALADELWGENPGASGSKTTGRGSVHWGRDMDAVFADLGIPPQVAAVPAAGSLAFLSRRTADGRDIYFLANQSARALDADVLFRSPEGQAQLWQPEDGSMVVLPDTPRENGRARVRLRLDPWGSTFVVFGPADATMPSVAEPGKVVRTMPVDGPWEVSFQKNRGAPEQVTFDTLDSWTSHSQPGIKYFSGYGTYRREFDWKPETRNLKPETSVILDLGQVGDVARVRVNGKDFGTLWKPPYRVDITSAAKAGKNQLEIAVVNTWVNRLIGDDQFPLENAIANVQQRKSIPPAELDKYPSGLLGPVRIIESF